MNGRRNTFSPWWIIVVVCLLALAVTMSGCAGGWQQVNDAFELPMLEYDRKYGCGGCDWAEGDLAQYAKMEAAEWQKGARDVMGHHRPESEDVRPGQSYNVTRWQGPDYEKSELGASIDQINDTQYAYGGNTTPVNSYEGAYPNLPFSTPCLDFSHRAYELIEMNLGSSSEMRVVTIVLNDSTLDKRGGPRYGYGQDKHAMLLVDGTIYDNGYLNNTPFDYEDLSFYGTEIKNVWSPEEYR